MTFANELCNTASLALCIGGAFATMISIVALVSGADLLRAIFCTIGFGVLTLIGACGVAITDNVRE